MKHIKRLSCMAFALLCAVALPAMIIPVPIADALGVQAADVSYPSVSSLTMPDVFSNNMMLQRDKTNRVWGLTVPGRSVTVILLRDNTAKEVSRKVAKADKSGLFSVELDAQEASYATYSLSVTDGSTNITYTNVLIGEVWLSSGQSNMELELQYADGGMDAIEKAVSGANGLDNSKIRMCISKEQLPVGLGTNGDYPYTPQYRMASFDAKGSGYYWSMGNVRDDLKISSAVTYWYALEMFEKLNRNGVEVPVAYIDTAVGATSIEAWMSRSSLESNSTVLNWLKNIKKNYVNQSTWNKSGSSNFNQMTAMFNLKIAPLAGYGIRGIIWYQGANNVGDQSSVDCYEQALPTMIRDWSQNYWGYSTSLPCVVVTLGAQEYDYTPDSLPLFNEMLSRISQTYPNTFVSVPIYDVGLHWTSTTFGSSHPAHNLVNEPVGRRAAFEALGYVYKMYDDYLPATYTSMQVKGHSVIVTFSHTAGGLQVHGNTLYGFAVAGKDRQFVSANAKVISNNQVLVWSDDVSSPVAVTYAYAGLNMASNLFNSLGIPVVPFRSDRTTSVYYQPKDWLNADSTTLWIAPSSSFAYNKQVWAADTVSASTATPSVVNDTVNYLTGSGSIRMQYAGKGSFGFGVAGIPNRVNGLYDPVFGQFSSFSSLNFSMYNYDDRQKQLTVQLKTWNGSIYTLLSGTSSNSTALTLKPSSGWQNFSVSLKEARSASGETVPITSLLSQLAGMQFTVRDTAFGSVSIDNLMLHRAAVTSSEEAADNSTAPVITLAAEKSSYTVGDKVKFTYSVAGDKNNAAALQTYISVVCGAQQIACEDNQFIAKTAGTYTIHAMVIDNEGNIGKADLAISVSGGSSGTGKTSGNGTISSSSNTAGRQNNVLLYVALPIFILLAGVGIYLIVRKMVHRKKT